MYTGDSIEPVTQRTWRALKSLCDFDGHGGAPVGRESRKALAGRIVYRLAWDFAGWVVMTLILVGLVNLVGVHWRPASRLELLGLLLGWITWQAMKLSIYFGVIRRQRRSDE